MDILSPSPWTSRQRNSAEIYRKLHAERFAPTPRRDDKQARCLRAALALFSAALILAALAIALIVTR